MGKRSRLLSAMMIWAGASVATAADVDLGGYSPACGVAVRHEGDRLTVDWPMEDAERGRLVLDLRRGRPLFAELGLGGQPLLQGVDPVWFLTVGTRQAPPDRPPEMPVWNVFFDKPASRPHQTHL